MSTIQISLNPFMSMQYSFPTEPERSSSLHEWIVVVGLVVLLHATAFALYLLQPESPAVMVNEMSISFAAMQMPQANVVPKPRPKPLPVPAPREEKPAPVAEPTPVSEPAVKEVAQPAPQTVTPPSPVLLDTEPDYRADYLNNPKPPYPLAANRMGFHGKVVLNVEVLAEGKAGQVLLYQSCGHAILDNAALQTVKTWRFTPARRAGQNVTEWFLVPVVFKLEGG